LPTAEDRLFFLLIYLKTDSPQVVQGRLFGMGQSKAKQWIHALSPALQVALHSLGDTPACSLMALAQRLGVPVANVATVVTPLAQEPEATADVTGAAAPVVLSWTLDAAPQKEPAFRVPKPQMYHLLPGDEISSVKLTKPVQQSAIDQYAQRRRAEPPQRSTPRCW